MTTSRSLLLGVNIDHAATLRQARYRGAHLSPHAEPDVVAFTREALAGARARLAEQVRDASEAAVEEEAPEGDRSRAGNSAGIPQRKHYCAMVGVVAVVVILVRQPDDFDVAIIGCQRRKILVLKQNGSSFYRNLIEHSFETLD